MSHSDFRLHIEGYCYSISGKRLAINAMIDESGSDLDSIDVIECDADHSMNSHFCIDWMRHRAFM